MNITMDDTLLSVTFTLGAALGLALMVFILVPTITDFHKIKDYKRTYNLIKNKEFRLVDMYGSILTFSDGSNLDITLFDDGSVKLVGGEYIHNFIFTFVNPFACYYFYKFKRLKNNIIEQQKTYNIFRQYLEGRGQKNAVKSFKFFRGY